MDHLTPAQRQEISEKGASASAKSSREKRIAFWIALGVPYEIGLKIYMQGYQCCYEQRRRKEQKLLRAPTSLSPAGETLRSAAQKGNSQ